MRLDVIGHGRHGDQARTLAFGAQREFGELLFGAPAPELFAVPARIIISSAGDGLTAELFGGARHRKAYRAYLRFGRFAFGRPVFLRRSSF